LFSRLLSESKGQPNPRGDDLPDESQALLNALAERLGDGDLLFLGLALSGLSIERIGSSLGLSMSSAYRTRDRIMALLAISNGEESAPRPKRQQGVIGDRAVRHELSSSPPSRESERKRDVLLRRIRDSVQAAAPSPDQLSRMCRQLSSREFVATMRRYQSGTDEFFRHASPTMTEESTSEALMDSATRMLEASRMLVHEINQVATRVQASLAAPLFDLSITGEDR
jgi:hypothetical protein